MTDTETDVAEVVLRAFHAASHENPLARGRLVGMRVDGVDRWAVVILRHGLDADVHVEEVWSVTRGGGRAAMTVLCAIADTHGASIELDAIPLKAGPAGVQMTRKRLRRWYASLGFRQVLSSDTMIRPARQ